MQLLKQGPKPKGCPLFMLQVAGAVVAAFLLIGLVIS